VPLTGLTLRLNGAFTDAKLTEDAPAAGASTATACVRARITGSASAPTSSSRERVQPFVGASVNYIGSRSRTSRQGAAQRAVLHDAHLNGGFDVESWQITFYGKHL